MKNLEIKEKIILELTKMGFNFAHCGTTYLVDSIEIIYNSKRPEIINNLEKNVYIKVAKKYTKKETTVKSNITKAVNCMNEKCIIEKKKANDEYYNLYPKNTAKSVINTVVLKIKN